jgi:hypothetical protein
MDVCTELLQLDRACTVAVGYLQYVGMEFPAHPTEEEARREYEQIWSWLGSRTIEDLSALGIGCVACESGQPLIGDGQLAERRRIQPLQIVEEQSQRVLSTREYADEPRNATRKRR